VVAVEDSGAKEEEGRAAVVSASAGLAKGEGAVVVAVEEGRAPTALVRPPNGAPSLLLSNGFRPAPPEPPPSGAREDSPRPTSTQARCIASKHGVSRCWLSCQKH
jgi:hypothetical protein